LFKRLKLKSAVELFSVAFNAFVGFDLVLEECPFRCLEATPRPQAHL